MGKDGPKTVVVHWSVVEVGQKLVRIGARTFGNWRKVIDMSLTSRRGYENISPDSCQGIGLRRFTEVGGPATRLCGRAGDVPPFFSPEVSWQRRYAIRTTV